MKYIVLIFIFIICSLCIKGQNLIGYDSDQIIKYMNKNHTNLVLETNFKNDHYKYLKFTDGQLDSTTILFFLSEKDKCTSVKMIYDLSMKKEILKDLNSLYTRINENEWRDKSRRRKATIILTEEDWFLTVSIKPE